MHEVRRFAFVVGNADYEHVDALKNPGNDCEDLYKTFKELGFCTLKCLDCSRQKLLDTLGVAKELARAAETIVFFYCGHGLQVDGENYVVPVDARFVLRQDLDNLVPFQFIIDTLSVDTATNFFFFDACRSDPFDRSREQVAMARESRGILVEDWNWRDNVAATRKGLASVEAPNDALIGFSAAPGETASDGVGRNSPYTEAMLLHLPTRGLEVQHLMARVGNTTRLLSRVAGNTRTQMPWVSHNLGTHYYFHPTDLRPVIELTVLGFVLGLSLAWTFFDADGCYVGREGAGLIFGFLLAGGLLRWGDATPAGAALVAVATMASWYLGGYLLEQQANVGHLGPSCRSDSPEFDVKIGFFAALAGLIALGGSLASAAIASRSFQSGSSWFGTIIAASLVLTGIYFMALFLMDLGLPTMLVQFFSVGLWFAALGAAVGFVLHRYVPDRTDQLRRLN